MSSSPPPAQPSLLAPRTTLLNLITHCRTSLNTPTTPSSPLPTPLPLLHDTATLLKAHTTRLSLSLRPPITTEAATKFLTELSASIVPSLTAAATSLDPSLLGETLCRDAKRRVDALLRELGEFVLHATSAPRGDTEGRGRLVDTAVVWSAADRVVELKVGGPAGAVERVLTEVAGIMGDAEGELKEWVESAGEDDDDGDDDGGDVGSDDEDEFWDSVGKKGPLEEEMRKRVEKSLKRMKLVGILLSAARKRRLGVKAEGRIQSDVKRLDRVAVAGKKLESLADELSMAYMEGEEEDSKRLHSEFEKMAAELAEMLEMGDDGKEDNFSPWFQNCRKALLDTA